MDTKDQHIHISEVIEHANTIAVLPGLGSGVDSFCAGAGLYHMLKEKGKTVTFIYPNAVPKGCENLLTAEELRVTAGNGELLVSIDYSGSSEASALYSTSHGVLYIKLSPVSKDFSLTNVKTALNIPVFEVIFTIGAQLLEDYGSLYREMKIQFYSSKLINLDIKDTNLKFGNYNVIEPAEQSLSLLVLNTSRYWSLKVSPPAAKALLQGITHSIN